MSCVVFWWYSYFWKCIIPLSEPSMVQNPTAIHSARDDFLKVYWNHASGDYDYYEVAIEYNSTRLQNQKLNKTQSECLFSDLVPGRLYTVTISTWSGQYNSTISIHGRTCEWLFVLESLFPIIREQALMFLQTLIKKSIISLITNQSCQHNLTFESI